MNRRTDSPRPAGPAPEPGVRLDKWLWAARFYKTRALAVEAIERGRVQVNGQSAKPGRELRPGDRLSLRLPGPPQPMDLIVRALSGVRGPATVARTLYEETPESQAARAEWQATRRWSADPAAAIEQGRPTKQARRDLEALSRSPWQRWSASLDDEDAPG